MRVRVRVRVVRVRVRVRVRPRPRVSVRVRVSVRLRVRPSSIVPGGSFLFFSASSRACNHTWQRLQSDSLLGFIAAQGWAWGEARRF